MEKYPSLYVDFLYYFNVTRDFYECHEVLEELWLEEGRERFYQGLLQVAVGWYHAQNKNRGGAIKMWRAALEKLKWIPEERWMGIDLKKVIDQTKEVLQRLESAEEEMEYDQWEPFTISILDPVLDQLVQEVNR
jgi:predicted metal-dependent hydrolase